MLRGGMLRAFAGYLLGQLFQHTSHRLDWSRVHFHLALHPLCEVALEYLLMAGAAAGPTDGRPDRTLLYG
jgi:hypothetical protein